MRPVGLTPDFMLFRACLECRVLPRDGALIR